MKENPLLGLVRERKNGRKTGIPSFCTANGIAIEAILRHALRRGENVLLEATSNQVNQFGGYTGMTPADYRDYVWSVADHVGFDRSGIILGGDHLGPQPFQNLNHDLAMEYACEMVRQYVLAGYVKIHLDTSMRLADDSREERLGDDVIAGRGAALLKAAEQAYEELLLSDPDAVHPVYVIGSEVPVPGGAKSKEGLSVTEADDFRATVGAYRRIFTAEGLGDRMKYVIAVVVQPGVEFGDDDVHSYVRSEASDLCMALEDFPDMVFEGHSTDYQRPALLREMVEDGIAILKVGPALTFAAREALFALAHMEDELVSDKSLRSNLISVVDEVMCGNPSNWEKYYRGTDLEISLKRAYSYSDRSRYYMGDSRICRSVETLFSNIDSSVVPMGLLHQYMPLQYADVMDGRIAGDARSLVFAAVSYVADGYDTACGR